MSAANQILLVILASFIFLECLFFWVGCFLSYLDTKKIILKDILNLKF